MIVVTIDTENKVVGSGRMTNNGKVCNPHPPTPGVYVNRDDLITWLRTTTYRTTPSEIVEMLRDVYVP